MTEFIMEPNMDQRRYEYQRSEAEEDLLKKKKCFVSYSVGPDGIYCTYAENNKFVEQSGRYLTLFEALMALPD